MNIMIIMPKFPHMWWVQQPPIGALYTSSVLKQEGYNVKVHDLRYEESNGWQNDIHSTDLVILQTAEYDLTQCYPWELDNIRKAVDTIRDINPFVKIVSVGPHGKVAPQLTQKQLKVDGVLVGENEVVVPSFLQEWDTYSESNQYFIYNCDEKTDLVNLPIPDYSQVDLSKYKSYVPLDGQIKEVKTGLILANRGCPFACDYCYIGYFGQNVRFRPTDLVINEIREMYNSGVKNYFFLDYTFTVNKKWVLELTDKIKELDIDITWGCETRVDVIDDELINAMAEAGCKYIWFGIESPDIKQMGVNKNLKKENIEKTLNSTVSVGIQPMAFMLVGFPDEDVSQILSWCEEQPFIFDHSVVLPRPGTPLFERMELNYGDYEDWNKLAEASYKKLENNREKVVKSFEQLTNLSNYFENCLRQKQKVENYGQFTI